MGLFRWVFIASLFVLLAIGYRVLKSSDLSPDSRSQKTDLNVKMKSQGTNAAQLSKLKSGHLAAKPVVRQSTSQPSISSDEINKALFHKKAPTEGFQKAHFYKKKMLAELKTGECFAMAYIFPKRMPSQNMNAVPVACKFAQYQL